MSEIQKCPNLVRGGGESTFFKNVPNSKMSQRSEGGGVNPDWDIVPNFLDFLFWWLPYPWVCYRRTGELTERWGDTVPNSPWIFLSPSCFVGCILTRATVIPWFILNGRSVPPGCILNGGTVPPFNLFLWLFRHIMHTEVWSVGFLLVH